MPDAGKKRLYFIFVLILFFMVIGSVIFLFPLDSQPAQEPKIPGQQSVQNSAGIALTFDDYSVDQWFEIKDILKKYHVNATFYVAHFNSLNASQINKLRILQDEGNEIAFHGLEHRDAVEYLKDHSIDAYLNDEIISGLDLMKKAGFNPVDFSYPSGHGTKPLTERLKKYFLHVRLTDSLKNGDGFYYDYGSNQTEIYGVGIDDITYDYSLDDILKSISTAKENDKIVIFYAHIPVQNNPQMYQLSTDRLEKILINGSENTMKFYKIAELQ